MSCSNQHLKFCISCERDKIYEILGEDKPDQLLRVLCWSFQCLRGVHTLDLYMISLGTDSPCYLPWRQLPGLRARHLWFLSQVAPPKSGKGSPNGMVSTVALGASDALLTRLFAELLNRGQCGRPGSGDEVWGRHFLFDDASDTNWPDH